MTCCDEPSGVKIAECQHAVNVLFLQWRMRGSSLSMISTTATSPHAPPADTQRNTSSQVKSSHSKSVLALDLESGCTDKCFKVVPRGFHVSPKQTKNKTLCGQWRDGRRRLDGTPSRASVAVCGGTAFRRTPVSLPTFVTCKPAQTDAASHEPMTHTHCPDDPH
jgi:hypothetical protein